MRSPAGVDLIKAQSFSPLAHLKSGKMHGKREIPSGDALQQAVIRVAESPIVYILHTGKRKLERAKSYSSANSAKVPLLNSGKN